MTHEEKKAVLRIGNGTKWSFLNGSWNDGTAGELIPPDGGGKEYIAVGCCPFGLRINRSSFIIQHKRPNRCLFRFSTTDM